MVESNLTLLNFIFCLCHLICVPLLFLFCFHFLATRQISWYSWIFHSGPSVRQPLATGTLVENSVPPYVSHTRVPVDPCACYHIEQDRLLQIIFSQNFPQSDVKRAAFQSEDVCSRCVYCLWACVCNPKRRCSQPQFSFLKQAECFLLFCFVGCLWKRTL